MNADTPKKKQVISLEDHLHSFIPPCDLDTCNGRLNPHHAIRTYLSTNSSFAKYFCYDSRRDECPYLLVKSGFNYCTYKENK